MSNKKVSKADKNLRSEMQRGNAGKFVSNKDFDKFKSIYKEVKKSGEKVETSKLASKYFEDKIEKLSSYTTPVNSLFDNMKKYVDKNPRLKIYVKQEGESKFRKVTLETFEIIAAKRNSEAWNLSKQMKEDDETAGTDIPEITVETSVLARTETKERIYIDFTTITPR